MVRTRRKPADPTQPPRAIISTRLSKAKTGSRKEGADMRFWMAGVPKNTYVVDGDIQWDDGTITGDPVLVSDVQRKAAEMHGYAVGPEQGPYTMRNHLADPLSAYILMLNLFDRRHRVNVAGDVPEIPSLPEGAR